MKVLVVGDLVVDVVAAPKGSVAVDSDTAARVALRGGGSAANAAAWLALAGAQVALVARIGDDMAGRLLREELSAGRVEPLLAVDASAATGTIVVLVEPDGRRTMLTDRGASALLAPRDLPAERFTAPAHLHLSGYTLLGQASRAAGLHALRLAAAAGMTSSVTPGTAEPLRQAGAESFLSWTAGATCCLANREEAGVLTGAGPGAPHAELALALAERYAEAVVTAGADGAAWASGTEVVALPAVDAAAVDTTGAGDAFAAGLLAAWLGGASREDALRAGLRLAAQAVALAGGRPPAAVSDMGLG
ncbi:MAG TPA: PfkB family carbohydrate kinase [Egibacteraceae bacterium]|nr:PfkB family carbohydrate kinase [Egibacteraceae bacterium]